MGSYCAQIPVGERKSGMPLSVETPAPVRTTQLFAVRNRPARSTASANAFQQIRERHVLERLDDDVRSREVERARDAVREADAEDAGGARRRDAVRRVLDGDRLVGGHAEHVERLEVQRRAGLAASRVAVRADDYRPPVHEAEPLEVRVDPRARAAGNDADEQAEVARILEVREDAGTQLLELEQLELPLPARRRHRLAIARRFEERVELVELVRPVERPDAQREAVQRHRHAVRLEDLRPRAQVDRLGVDERAVEVEEQSSDHARHRRVHVVDGFRFSTEVRVRFAETDAQRIAHNATYLVWFEVARVAYLDEYTAGYRAFQDAGYEATVVETHVRYLTPAVFDDVIRIWTRCIDVRGARFRYDYELVRVGDGARIAEGWRP